MAKQTISQKIDELTTLVCELAKGQVALAQRLDALEGTPKSTKKATPSKGKGKGKTTSSTKKAPKGKGKSVNEVDKAKKNAEARLAYKQDKRTRNCLTKAENRLVAKQMRERGENPADAKAWAKAKAEFIKNNPLTK